MTFAEREEIALGRASVASIRSIAARLGRSPATISRELRRNAEPRVGASSAHAGAWVRASRRKPAKLASNVVLRAKVEQDLETKYSPEQLASRLRVEFPDDPEMWVSPRRSISRCMWSRAVRCAVNWPSVCARAGRCATSLFYGSGVMIGSRLILTAATSSTGVPDGSALGIAPFGEAWATQIVFWRENDTWLTNDETAFDQVVCMLTSAWTTWWAMPATGT